MEHYASRTELIRAKVGAMDVLLAPRVGSGLIAAQLLTRRGSTDEGEGERGLASFTAGMLKRGTATRSSSQIAFDLESLGAMTGHSGGVDTCSSSIRSAAADFPAALEILMDCVRNPVFDPEEIETERQATLAHLRRVDDDKFDCAYRGYIRRIFAGHGYGHPSEGEIEDVEAVTREKLIAWSAKTFHPANMLFVASGDFEPDTMLRMIERAVEGWASPGDDPPRYDQKTAPPIQSTSAVLEKNLEQGFIVMGFRTPDMAHPDRPALRLACAALGEGFGGRLFTRLRDELSLAYAVGSFLSIHRLGGHMVLYIGTEAARLEEAREGLLAEAEKLREEVLTEADLERARQYVIGKFLMDHQSLASRVGHLARWEDIGLGAEYDEAYVEDLRKVAVDDVIRATRKWWIHPTVVALRPKSAAGAA